MVMQWQRELPEAQGSITHRKPQTRELWRSASFSQPGRYGNYQIRVTAEWGDECGNGSNSFYYREEVVTANSDRVSEWVSTADDCAQAFVADIPQWCRELEKWNGCHPFGPWYYIENTLYLAGDKDHNGLRAGEKKQIVNGKSKELAWNLVAVSKIDGSEVRLSDLVKNVDGPEQPTCDYTLEYRPWCHIGVGKGRELDAARSVAVWPDATYEQLTDENLATALKERLPGLLVEFRRMIESLGFVW